jgi:hydroxymethylbilane synthase
MKDALVIGSRGSKLALTQAGLIKGELERLHLSLEVRIEIIKTTGDVKTDPLSLIGGKGVFTKELEDALLARRIDIAVHSLKDLPTILPDDLLLAAICKREDPRDALVLPVGQNHEPATSEREQPDRNHLSELPSGARVGTSSPRRLAQLKHLRGDLVFKDLRGNVDTRLRKLDEGEYDALILACAGLRRLDLEDRISTPLPTNQMLPAIGQGALGIETRAGDDDTIAAVSKLDHKFTRLACLAERAFLHSLGGGCLLPIAAYATVREKRVKLDGLVTDIAGKQIIRERLAGGFDEAEDIGKRLGERLMNMGAAALLAKDYDSH